MARQNPELVQHGRTLVKKSRSLVEYYLDSGVDIDLVGLYGSLARWITQSESLRPDHMFKLNSDGDVYLKPQKLPRGKDELYEYSERLNSLVVWDSRWSNLSVTIDYIPTNSDDQTPYRLLKKQIDRDFVPLYQNGQFVELDF
jgi:hypothetical protein